MVLKNLTQIPKFDDYFVDADSNVYRVKKLKKHFRSANNYKYLAVHMCNKDGQFNVKISVIMLTTFVSPRPEGMFACHGIKGSLVDTLDNLYWATPKQNMADKYRDGTQQLGEKCPNSKLNELQVRIIRRAYVKRKSRHISTIDSFGLSGVQLAKIFNVDPSVIYDIIHRKIWNHI